MSTPLFRYVANTIFILAVAAGCNSRQSEFSALLDKAEQYIETCPDSAMLLVDSLYYFEKKSQHEEAMRYLVLRAQILHENHLPLTADTLVFGALNYHCRHDKDPHLTALAYLYSGFTCYELGDSVRAVDYFAKAEAMGGQKLEKSLERVRKQAIARQPKYEKNPANDLRRYKKMHIAQSLRSQKRTYTFMYILFFAFVVVVLILVGMLEEKKAKLKMRENIDVLRETTKDLLGTQYLDQGETTMAYHLLKWKFDVMKKTFLLKCNMTEKMRKENEILLGFLKKLF